jgi:hypothetical protein
MKKEDLAAYLVQHGWTKDRFGHYHKGEYRFKFQKISVRLEKGYHTADTEYSKGEKRWLPVRSAYLKDLSIKDDKIHGLK